MDTLYKKYNNEAKRQKFSKQIRGIGNGFIPIVLDSHDADISKSINICLNKSNNNTMYGAEISMYIDSTLEDLKSYICVYLIDYIPRINKFNYVIYNGNEIIKLKPDDVLGVFYKKYKNTDDNILYIHLIQPNSLLSNCNVM